MHLSTGRFSMLKRQKLKEQQSLPELLGLPPAEAKTNELITKHMHTRGFVLVLIHVLYMY